MHTAQLSPLLRYNSRLGRRSQQGQSGQAVRGSDRPMYASSPNAATCVQDQLSGCSRIWKYLFRSSPEKGRDSGRDRQCWNVSNPRYGGCFTKRIRGRCTSKFFKSRAAGKYHRLALAICRHWHQPPSWYFDQTPEDRQLLLADYLVHLEDLQPKKKQSTAEKERAKLDTLRRRRAESGL